MHIRMWTIQVFKVPLTTLDENTSAGSLQLDRKHSQLVFLPRCAIIVRSTRVANFDKIINLRYERAIRQMSSCFPFEVRKLRLTCCTLACLGFIKPRVFFETGVT